jgi:hypothetical protein
MPEGEVMKESPDFSPVLGGPLFQLFRRTHLSGDALELMSRRILTFALFAWLPLLVLALLGGHALGGGVKIPFLADIETHVRFLIALPVLIAAELIVHRQIRPVVQQFAVRRMITEEQVPKFSAAINAAMRVRNSTVLELVLLVLVYTAGHWFWRNGVALEQASWYATPDGTNLNLTYAGYWLAYVSVPLFQFILLRWYFRIVTWFWLLWRISKLDLLLTPTHPDRTGGLGFLGDTAYAYAPILFAQGALLAGVIASRIFYDGQALMAFKAEVALFVVVFVLFFLGPLAVFSGQLARTKRKGLREYGVLASRYVQEFDGKWIHGGAPGTEALMGSGDIQSLADLGNSIAVIREMRPIPFGMNAVIILVAATVSPLLPLTLTVFSAEEVLLKVIKILL